MSKIKVAVTRETQVPTWPERYPCIGIGYRNLLVLFHGIGEGVILHAELQSEILQYRDDFDMNDFVEFKGTYRMEVS